MLKALACPSKVKKDSEAAGKTSPGIYTLLLEQAALLYLIFGVMAEAKSLTGASLP